MNLTALTPCCVDLYPQTGLSFPGGNSLNVASRWKTLAPEAMVSVITCLGTDSNGDLIMDFLKRKNIDCSRVYRREGLTAYNELRVDESGERFGIEGAWNGGVYETFLLSGDDWEFVGRQDLVAVPANNPNFSEVISRKRSRQVIAVDYLDVANDLPIGDSIAFTDIAFISTPPKRVGVYEDMALSSGRLLVVTMGPHGSRAFHHGVSYYQPALEVTGVVDTTGCGDAYQAAFSYHYLMTGDMRESMLAGAREASKVLQAWSGTGDLE